MGCRQKDEQPVLMRFVVVPGQITLSLDVRSKAPGRGAYLHLSRSCIETASKRKAFSRAFGDTVRIGEVEQLLEQMTQAAEGRLIERLGLARRAGAVAVGSEPVRRAMREDQAQFIFVSRDASDATRRQLLDNCRRKSLPVGQHFLGAKLAKAVGEDFVAALAVTEEPFATDIRMLSMSLLGVQSGPEVGA